MPPHILLIGQLPPPVHGSNVMTERFMAALDANGFSREIVQKTFSSTMAQVGKASFNKILKVPDLYRRVEWAIRERRPDTCVYFISVGLSSLLIDCLMLRLLRKKEVPYVLYFHGKGYRAYDSAKYFPVRAVVRHALEGAFGGIVLGERLKYDISHCIPSERLYVLPNGIPPIENSPVRSSRKENGVVRILFLSNLIPAKGPMRFLEMAKRVRKKEPRVFFTMAGRHTTEEYLCKLKYFTKNEGIEDCVRIPGPVYGKDKDRLLSETDILVFPTRKDVFGLVNIEAMQWGIPVVSSTVGAIPEIIRDGVNGFIVDPDDIEALADRVLRLVRDPGLRQCMGKAGRELYERNYSLEAYYRNTRRALEYFLSPRPLPLPFTAGERGCRVQGGNN
jgi:glycosyltransferase involved in cell wall biosynthesis